MGCTSTASAALISRLGGLAVYDTDFNITWLKDANANGTMNWQAAKDWAAGLNVGGYTGWRLPNADPGCGATYDCINSEVGHLFYTELGVQATRKITSSTSSYLALFTNVKDSTYWTGTEYASRPSDAWGFDTSGGIQNFPYKGYDFYYAWAVRDGDVGSVPEPGILGLLGIGTLAWVTTCSRRKG